MSDESWYNGDRGFLKWVQGYCLDQGKAKESAKVQEVIERVDELVKDLDSYAEALEYIGHIGSQFDDLSEPRDPASRLVRAVTVAMRTLKVRNFDEKGEPVFVSVTKRGDGPRWPMEPERDKLKAENERLRTALKEISHLPVRDAMEKIPSSIVLDCIAIANQALAKDKGEKGEGKSTNHARALLDNVCHSKDCETCRNVEREARAILTTKQNKRT